VGTAATGRARVVLGATALVALVLLACFGLCLAAAQLTHGGAPRAPSGAPAGATVVPAGD
jgi:hypothetical protein